VTVVGAFLIGFVLALMLLASALAARPMGFTNDGDVDVAMVVLQGAIAQEFVDGKTPLYVKSDLSQVLISRLREQHPAIRAYDWSERPPDDGCKIPESDLVYAFPCERPDYVGVTRPSYVLWRTVMIGTWTFSGGCEFFLFEWFNDWRVLSERCFVI
jgi:hypothetical protein